MNVAPFAGAWIEIYPLPVTQVITVSLPSRERGLKFFWIICINMIISRSLRGSVD